MRRRLIRAKQRVCDTKVFGLAAPRPTIQAEGVNDERILRPASAAERLLAQLLRERPRLPDDRQTVRPDAAAVSTPTGWRRWSLSLKGG